MLLLVRIANSLNERTIEMLLKIKNNSGFEYITKVIRVEVKDAANQLIIHVEGLDEPLVRNTRKGNNFLIDESGKTVDRF